MYDTSRCYAADASVDISIRRRRLQRRSTPTGPVGAGGDPHNSVHYGTSTRPAGGVCELRFTILSPTSQSTVCGPEDVASRYSAVPPLGYAVDRTGRLGLRRRPDSLTRANPAYATTNAPASHGGRRGLTGRPVKHYLAPRDIRANRSNDPGCRRMYQGGAGQGLHGQRHLQRYLSTYSAACSRPLTPYGIGWYREQTCGLWISRCGDLCRYDIVAVTTGTLHST